ncbi:MAG: 5'/3'-nucleotidase SurE [bacterium]
MKILLTNDDGYYAKGLWALARELAKSAEVKIVAPERQRSAISHAVTLHKPLRLRREKPLEEKNIEVYHSNGTPADCAMLGLLEVLPDADLLISGINSGPNLGEDILYSGTVAAAMEAALLGKPAAAVSIAEYDFDEFDLAAHFTAAIAPQIIEQNLPPKTILNINVPPVRKDECRGFRVTALGTRRYEDVLHKRTDPRGNAYFWITGTLIRESSPSDATDYSAIQNGFISITPITLDMTNSELLTKLAFHEVWGVDNSQ